MSIPSGSPCTLHLVSSLQELESCQLRVRGFPLLTCERWLCWFSASQRVNFHDQPCAESTFFCSSLATQQNALCRAFEGVTEIWRRSHAQGHDTTFCRRVGATKAMTRRRPWAPKRKETREVSEVLRWLLRRSRPWAANLPSRSAFWGSDRHLVKITDARSTILPNLHWRDEHMQHYSAQRVSHVGVVPNDPEMTCSLLHLRRECDMTDSDVRQNGLVISQMRGQK